MLKIQERCHYFKMEIILKWRGLKLQEPLYMSLVFTVKPVLRDHCHERPPVLTDHTFSAEGPTLQYN